MLDAAYLRWNDLTPQKQHFIKEETKRPTAKELELNIKSKHFDNLKVFWTYSGQFIPRKNYIVFMQQLHPNLEIVYLIL